MRLVDRHGYNVLWNPCSCCGMNYSAVPTKQNSSGNGINVIYGKQGKELVRKNKELGKQTNIKHVKTKNGDLTVITRSEYVAG